MMFVKDARPDLVAGSAEQNAQKLDGELNYRRYVRGIAKDVDVHSGEVVSFTVEKIASHGEMLEVSGKFLDGTSGAVWKANAGHIEVSIGEAGRCELSTDWGSRLVLAQRRL